VLGIEPSPKTGTTLDRTTRLGLGKPLESYCNSMEAFPRVGSRNRLKLQICCTPSTGTKIKGSMRAGFYGEGSQQFSESYAEVRINLTNATMWAGKTLEALGNPFPAELADKANVQ
jgi:hypothetical protein